nr:UDP-N-acetylglucosamine 2-epimerase [uncultured Methanoregula sp.]
MKKRKICVVVASRANYGRVKSVLLAIKEHPNLELQLIIGASALLYRFGKAIDIIKEDGFVPLRSIFYVIEGENLNTQAKSTGLGIIELASAFEDLKPDVVVTVADRFETMSTAIAASYMNIPLAHIQGGEVTGNIDESVRHAITKLAHIHFPATKISAERILKLGEEPWRVHCTGCPSIDLLQNSNLTVSKKLFDRYGGIGHPIHPDQSYILMVQHPVTTEFGEGTTQVTATLNALKIRKEQKIVLWPNIDAGSDHVSKAIRVFREQNLSENFHFYRGFRPEDYNAILNNAACVVGNSSSFIREGSYLGIPAVIVGNRQEGREHSNNIVYSDYSERDIALKVDMQIKNGKYSRSTIFGDGTAGKRIAHILAEIPLSIQKKITY